MSHYRVTNHDMKCEICQLYFRGKLKLKVHKQEEHYS